MELPKLPNRTFKWVFSPHFHNPWDFLLPYYTPKIMNFKNIALKKRCSWGSVYGPHALESCKPIKSRNYLVSTFSPVKLEEK
jgi:hypothetical protein